MTYGWHVCEAARKLQAGADVKSVVEYLEDQLARMEIMPVSYTHLIHICENNTIYGTRFTKLPHADGVPLVADLSLSLIHIYERSTGGILPVLYPPRALRAALFAHAPSPLPA